MIMKTIRDNKYRNFLEISQRVNKTYNYWMCCSVFAPFINLSFNTSYTKSATQVYSDIDTVIEECLKAGTLDLRLWGSYNPNNEMVSELQMASNDRFYKTESYFYDYLNKWYAVQVYFYANRELLADIRDNGKIDKYEDYMSLKWDDFAHTFNIIKKGGKYFVLDSYFQPVDTFDKLIEIGDIEKFRGFIWNTCYCFI